jgi:putative sigma-54 modulation protein
MRRSRNEGTGVAAGKAERISTMTTTNNTNVPIHITPHHLRLSPALVDFVHSKIAKIPRFASDVLATDIVLRRHHGTSNGKRFSASGRLSLAGRDIHATATHEDLYTAIVNLVTKLARRSRKRKARFAKSYTTPRVGWTATRRHRDLLAVATGPEAEADHVASWNPHENNGNGSGDLRDFPFRATTANY